MSKAKRLAAAVLASAVCAASFTGCTDTTYAMTAGGEKINAGIYIYNIYSEMSYRNMMLYYSEGVTEDFFSQKIEGKDYAEYLSDYAMKSTKEYAAVKAKFEELDLELTKDQLKEIQESVNSAWDSQGELYEYEGISKESIKLAQQASYMRTELFNHYYGEGGEEEVSNADMESFLKDNYMRYKMITISKAAEGDENADETNAEAKEHFDEFSAQAEGVSFTDFDLVISAYNDHLAAEQAAASEESSQAADDTDSGSSADSAASADSVAGEELTVSEAATESTNAAADEGTADESLAADTEELPDSTAEEEVTDTVTSDSEAMTDGGDLNLDPDAVLDSESGETESEPDPYANEQMVNFSNIKKTYEENKDTKDYDDSSYKLNEFINNMSAGSVETYENDTAYYIIAKGDVAERASEYAEENHDSLLQEMKSEDFQAKIDSWVEAMDFKINDKAIKRYTPKVVYDRQVEYTEKHSTK
ncbi:MAG: hypothetical protein IJ645_02920 [Ruminococcus sp.]|nr:hypothetical protein [Ruminococcus sp.]